MSAAGGGGRREGGQLRVGCRYCKAISFAFVALTRREFMPGLQRAYFTKAICSPRDRNETARCQDLGAMTIPSLQPRVSRVRGGEKGCSCSFIGFAILFRANSADSRRALTTGAFGHVARARAREDFREHDRPFKTETHEKRICARTLCMAVQRGEI